MSGIADGAWPWLTHLVTRDVLLARTRRRDGEMKLGEVVSVGADVAHGDSHQDLHSRSSHRPAPRYGVIGIPEDIGVTANLGRPGARGGWNAFLDAFVNMQANGAGFDAKDIVVLGALDVADLQEQCDGNQDASAMRHLILDLDRRVTAAASAALRRGMEIVVIGGGHNNCLPLMKACAEHYGAPLGVRWGNPVFPF